MTLSTWKLLTKGRAGVTQGLPARRGDLAWVTNTVTLIYGERDAVLVDGSSRSVVAAMQMQIEPDVVHSLWEPRIPGPVPSKLVVPEALEGDAF